MAKDFFLRSTPIKLSSGAVIVPILSLIKKRVRQSLLEEQLEKLRQVDCLEEEYCLDYCAREDFFAFSCESCPFRFQE